MSQPQFFVDHKRGEVNELQAILRNPKVTRDPMKKREVIKKVIAYMTLGIDVSRIFSEMIMAANTTDLVQKKMVYHYLCSYAAQKADLAILAINTLQKDCRDEDPMTRGLALRSLCSLRLDNVTEYVLLPLRKGLNDASPYVRKTAVVGCAKVYRLAPDAIKGADFVDILYNMLKDKDPQVITNVINALNEILSAEGGMVFNKQIVMYLLNRLREFHEWAQCVVLDLVAKYTPEDDAEMFDVMNLLEDRLKHSNSAVVMGTTKVFLKFTRHNPAVHTEVYKRLKPPLLTLMGGGSHELAFAVLSHINVLVGRQPGVFDEDYKHFYVRFNDPVHLKKLKVKILASLANEGNFGDILNELAEYVTEVDVEIARIAISNVAKVGIKVNGAVDEAIDQLIAFLDLNMDYVSAEAVIALRDLLRKYPDRHEEVIPALTKCMQADMDESEGKQAVIWMMGEYGDTIPDSPYILEPLIDSFEDEPSSAVRNELLTAAMKLFFKRPPEMQKMLGRLLKMAMDDVSKVDVRDRALLYYRLLRMDVHEAARIVNCPKVAVEQFVNSEEEETKEKIFMEFNSLCAIYDKPSDKFVKYVPEDEEEEEEEEAQQHHQPPPVQQQPAPVQQQQAPAPTTDSLDLDLMNFGAAAAAPVSAGPSLTLDPSPSVDANTFQGGWGSFPASKSYQVSVGVGRDQGSLEQALAAKSVLCMASGGANGQFKFYFFASSAGHLYLLEAVFAQASGVMQVTCKTNAPADTLDPFESIVRSAF